MGELAVTQDVDVVPLEPRRGTASFVDSDIGAVVAGCIVVFDVSVSQLHRTDVTSSILFVQLAASAKAQRYRQWKEWYKQYHAVLQGIGWVLGGAVAPTRWDSGGPFVLDSPVTALFGERAGIDAKLLVSEAVTTFRKDLGSRGQDLFESASHSGSLGNFQVALVAEDAEGDVRLRIGEFMFQSVEPLESLALEEFSASTRMYTSFCDLTLNEQAFAGGRKTIADRLGDRLEAQVALLREVLLPDPDEPIWPPEETYDASDPFQDGLWDNHDPGSETGSSQLFYEAPPVIESLLLDEPGNRIVLSEERTADRQHLYIVLEVPNRISWWKTITMWTVRIPPGQDPRQFVTNVHFLVRRVQADGLTDSSVVRDGQSTFGAQRGHTYARKAAFGDPNGQYLGKIETKDSYREATFRLDAGTLDGQEVHLEFHKGGFLGTAAKAPIEFCLRGGLGSLYRFRWERD